MSGGGAASGGSMIVGMPVAHAGMPALATPARAVFVTARSLADADGIVADRGVVADHVGLSRVQVRYWFGYLEQTKFEARPLCRRSGARELWVLLADMAGIPRRNTSVVDVQQRDRLGRTTGGEGWRVARARLGGMKRAMNEAIARRQAAEAELEDIATKLYADRHAETQLGTSAETEALRADLVHIAACGACARCDGIRLRVAGDRARYASARDLTATIERAEAVARAGSAFFAAMSAQGVGAAQRRIDARNAFARAIEAST